MTPEEQPTTAVVEEEGRHCHCALLTIDETVTDTPARIGNGSALSA